MNALSPFSFMQQPSALPKKPLRRTFQPLDQEEAARLEREEAAANDDLANSPEPTSTGPRSVAPKAWAAIFPPDRDAVKAKAAWLYRSGDSGEDALEKARLDVWRESMFASSNVSAIYERLRKAYQGIARSQRLEDQILKASYEVLATARKHGHQILNARNPLSQAWASSTWQADKGRCLLTGERLTQSAGDGGAPKYINPSYVDDYPKVMGAWCSMVVEQAKRLQEEDQEAIHAYDVWHDDVDPDDSSTWDPVDVNELNLIVPNASVENQKSTDAPEEQLKDGGFLDGLADE